jgi:hypothetical protein
MSDDNVIWTSTDGLPEIPLLFYPAHIEEFIFSISHGLATKS